MVEIADIVDRKSAEAWLEAHVADVGEDLGKQHFVYLASRAAARTSPSDWAFCIDSRQTFKMSELMHLRALITSCVVGNFPSSEINDAAFTPNFIKSPPGHASVYAAAFYVLLAARTYTDEALIGFTVDAISAGPPIVKTYEDFSRDVLLLEESGRKQFSPIWPSESPIAQIWADLKHAIRTDPSRPENWSFWIAWYDRLLEGKDIYAQDLHDILITLTDEDWDKGPAHINPKFDSVLALYQADRTPNAEIIDINPETHKFRATLVPLIPIENSEIRQKMLDAADTFND